jgi:hypothetical protein
MPMPASNGPVARSMRRSETHRQATQSTVPMPIEVAFVESPEACFSCMLRGTLLLRFHLLQREFGPRDIRKSRSCPRQNSPHQDRPKRCQEVELPRNRSFAKRPLHTRTSSCCAAQFPIHIKVQYAGEDLENADPDEECPNRVRSSGKPVENNAPLMLVPSIQTWRRFR